MIDQPDIVTISSAGLIASIAPLGAELQGLQDHEGQAFLWHGDAAWWTGRAPILFPIVGALAGDTHTVGGKSYTLKKHGFARQSRFTCVSRSTDKVTLRLEDSEPTLAAYPYRFRLDVAYSLVGQTLLTVATVTNTDDQPIPVSFGYHPAFLWPLPGGGQRDAQSITFEADEPVPASRINADGLLIGEEPLSRIVNRRLKLSDDLFDDDALLYLKPTSRRVIFGATDGQGTALDVAFPDMPNLGIWTKPGGAPYVCIEPWYGFASPAGFTGPLLEKPGSVVLAAGASKDFTMSITVIQRPS